MKGQHSQNAILALSQLTNSVLYLMALRSLNIYANNEIITQFFFTATLIGTFQAFFDFGMSKIIVRGISRLTDTESIGKYAGLHFIMSLLVSAVIVCIMIFSANYIVSTWLGIAIENGENMHIAILYFSAAFVLNIPIEVVKNSFIATRRTILYSILTLANGGLILLMAVYLSFFSELLKFETAFLFCKLVIFMFAIFMFHYLILENWNNLIIQKHSLKHMLTELKDFAKIGMSNAILKNVDRLLLAKLLTTEMYIYYETVFQVLNRLSGLIGIINNFLLSNIVKKRSENSAEIPKCRDSILYYLFVIIPSTSIIWFENHIIFEKFFKLEKTQSYDTILLVLLGAFLLNIIIRTYNTYFVSLNSEREILRNQIIAFPALFIFVTLYIFDMLYLEVYLLNIFITATIFIRGSLKVVQFNIIKLCDYFYVTALILALLGLLLVTRSLLSEVEHIGRYIYLMITLLIVISSPFILENIKKTREK